MELKIIQKKEKTKMVLARTSAMRVILIWLEKVKKAMAVNKIRSRQEATPKRMMNGLKWIEK